VGTYAKSETGGALRQGEILTNLTQYAIDVGRLRAGEIVVDQIMHPYVIVLSQDCDLDQDFQRRSAGQQDDLLASVTFCAMAPADDDFRKDIGLNGKEWKRFRQNQDPRRHYLRDVPGADDVIGEGLPELAIDFRQYFSLPTDLAYFAVESAQRRCRLEQPYAEHLNNRFSWHMSRVALPRDHHLPLTDEAPPTEQAPALQAGVAETVAPTAAPLLGAEVVGPVIVDPSGAGNGPGLDNGDGATVPVPVPPVDAPAPSVAPPASANLDES
jgi:hypothetical protein